MSLEITKEIVLLMRYMHHLHCCSCGSVLNPHFLLKWEKLNMWKCKWTLNKFYSLKFDHRVLFSIPLFSPNRTICYFPPYPSLFSLLFSSNVHTLITLSHQLNFSLRLKHFQLVDAFTPYSPCHPEQIHIHFCFWTDQSCL